MCNGEIQLLIFFVFILDDRFAVTIKSICFCSLCGIFLKARRGLEWINEIGVLPQHSLLSVGNYMYKSSHSFASSHFGRHSI